MTDLHEELQDWRDHADKAHETRINEYQNKFESWASEHYPSISLEKHNGEYTSAFAEYWFRRFVESKGMPK